MSDTVLGWLFGGWSFGRSPDNAGAERDRLGQFEDGDRESGGHALDADTDDDHLVAQVRAGNTAAFERLFRRYHVPLVEFAASYVGSGDEAGEVVATFFAWLWEHRATWTTTAGVSAYLFGAVRNRALNMVRDRSRYHRRTAKFQELGEMPGMAAPPFGLSEQTERDDSIDTVLRLMAKLPERRRLILSLRWTHELTWDEIAAVLGVTRAAAQREHSRILASLRAELRAS